MLDQGPLCREGTPLMISEAFAVVLSLNRFGIRCPILHVPLMTQEVHDKKTEINGLTLQQHFFELKDCAIPSMADRIRDPYQGLSSNRRTVSSIACQLQVTCCEKGKEKAKQRKGICQQGNPCLRELRKRLTSGACKERRKEKLCS